MTGSNDKRGDRIIAKNIVNNITGEKPEVLIENVEFDGSLIPKGEEEIIELLVESRELLEVAQEEIILINSDNQTRGDEFEQLEIQVQEQKEEIKTLVERVDDVESDL